MSDLRAVALTEWEHFKGSKTVKAVLALVTASTAAYAQGLMPGATGEAVSLKAWLGTLALSVVALTLRHALAGVEAKIDALPKTADPAPKELSNVLP